MGQQELIEKELSQNIVQKECEELKTKLQVLRDADTVKEDMLKTCRSLKTSNDLLRHELFKISLAACPNTARHGQEHFCIQHPPYRALAEIAPSGEVRKDTVLDLRQQQHMETSVSSSMHVQVDTSRCLESAMAVQGKRTARERTDVAVGRDSSKFS